MSRSQDRSESDLLEKKKASLKKIGINLKADKAKVLEDDEYSESSDIKKKYKNTMQNEKVEKLSKRLYNEAETKNRTRQEMTENKVKRILGDCPFKPNVNKLTNKQRQYRESRFVAKDPEVQKQFQLK